MGDERFTDNAQILFLWDLVPTFRALFGLTLFETSHLADLLWYSTLRLYPSLSCPASGGLTGQPRGDDRITGTTMEVASGVHSNIVGNHAARHLKTTEGQSISSILRKEELALEVGANGDLNGVALEVVLDGKGKTWRVSDDIAGPSTRPSNEPERTTTDHTVLTVAQEVGSSASNIVDDTVHVGDDHGATSAPQPVQLQTDMNETHPDTEISDGEAWNRFRNANIHGSPIGTTNKGRMSINTGSLYATSYNSDNISPVAGPSSIVGAASPYSPNSYGVSPRRRSRMYLPGSTTSFIDVTEEIDDVSVHPISEGGFCDIHTARMRGEGRVALKKLRLLGSLEKAKKVCEPILHLGVITVLTNSFASNFSGFVMKRKYGFD